MLRMAGRPMIIIFHCHCVYTCAPLYFKNDSKLKFWFWHRWLVKYWDLSNDVLCPPDTVPIIPLEWTNCNYLIGGLKATERIVALQFINW